MAQSARSTAGVRATVTALLCLVSGFSLGLLGGSCAAPTDPGADRVAAAATGNLEVLVRDTQLRPVAGARILVGDVAAVSDTAGRALLPVQARGRVVGQVTKAGFLDASVVGELSEGARLRVFATMVAAAPPQWFKAESGATLVAGPVSLELPEDAFQNQKGDLVAGMIEANLTPVRVADLLNVGLPWTLEGVPADGGPAGIVPQQRRTVQLLSFGMLDGVFRSKGESLQLRPGKTARMRYRLDTQGASRMQADGAAGVPLWFYKMDTGQWQEEGRCLIKEDEQGKFCEGELAHFTSWNLDVPAGQEDCIRVRVTDSRTGTPLSGSEVLVTADRVMYSSGVVSTGANGTSCINIPFGVRTTVMVRASGYKDSAVQVVTGTGVAGSMCASSTCPLYAISLVPTGSSATCRLPQIDCGGVCTDPDSDDNNCGSCGVNCSGGTICDSGSCECANPGQTNCSGTCINTSSDSSNCGSCGRRCSSVARGSTCQAGTCVCTGATLTICPAAASFQCVDTNSDNNNCGRCGVVCASGTRCASGACVSPWKKITHPPMSVDDLYSVSAAGSSTILASGKSGRMLFLKNPISAPTWDVVNPRIAMTDVKDDLGSSYVFGRGYTFFSYGADSLLVGTQGALTFPNQTWSRSMAAPGHNFVAVTGVDPSGAGTIPEVFAVADDGTIANLSGAWKQNAATHPLQAVWVQRVPSAATAVELAAGGANGHLITARYESGSLSAGTLNTSRVVKDGVNSVEITGITGMLTTTFLGLNKTLFVSGVVGTGGVIMRSTDGGNTFTRVHLSTKPLRAIAMSGNEIFAVGDAATVVHGSANGGLFQVEALSGETADLRAVYLNSEVVVVVGKQTSWRRTF